MTVDLTIQRACGNLVLPDDECFDRWASAALPLTGQTLLTIRLVDLRESADLNLRFRGKQGATNVLSFAAELPLEYDLPLLGDIVICAPLVLEQAARAGKNPEAHWAHLVIHGVLHLLGFDHQDDAQAHVMESREISLLDSLGYANPYL